MDKKRTSLLVNSRFYILMSTILLSVGVVSYLQLQISSEQVFYIRTEQVFGLLAILYWYFALIISPIGYVVGKHRTKRLEFARRAIGVSAAYFAVLHGAVALWGQLGGVSELALLPLVFKWSLAGGAVAVLVLLVMAATSFDKVVSFMTFKRWKLLHRLTYCAWILVVFHIWTIGTHLAYPSIQWVAFIALVILSGLELFRTIKLINEKYLHFEKTEVVTLFGACWVVVSVSIAMIPIVVKNYHSQHTNHFGHSGSLQQKEAPNE